VLLRSISVVVVWFVLGWAGEVIIIMVVLVVVVGGTRTTTALLLLLLLLLRRRREANRSSCAACRRGRRIERAYDETRLCRGRVVRPGCAGAQVQAVARVALRCEDVGKQAVAAAQVDETARGAGPTAPGFRVRGCYG
jgi:hypothetical protein